MDEGTVAESTVCERGYLEKVIFQIPRTLLSCYTPRLAAESELLAHATSFK